MAVNKPTNTEDIIDLLSALELEEVMEQACHILKSALGAEAAAIFMWDSDLEHISDRLIMAEKNKDFKTLAESFATSFDPACFAAPPAGDPPKTRILLEELPDDLELSAPRSILKHLGDIVCVRMMMCASEEDGEQLRAVALLSGQELDTEDTAAAAEAIGAYPLALALSRAFEIKELARENERLRGQYEEMEDKTSSMEEQTRKLIHDVTARDSIKMKQLERERLVYWISNAVRSSVHIQEVLDMTVEKLGNQFSVSRAVLFRADERGNVPEVYEYVQSGVESVKHLFATEDGQEFVLKALSKESPESLENPDFDDRCTYNREFLKLMSITSGLIVPLVMRTRVLGALFLQDLNDAREWSIDDISLIGSLADNLSVAIENAELHQERERQAVTDGLTGVANRRAFNDSLLREFERAKRYEQPLSLIVIDLDFLKKINDKYGHMAGDEAIKAIGQVLRQSSRSIDFPARYGGEEFCLLLPNTEIDMAEQLAERLRRLITEVTLEGHGSISASLGVASFPLHADGSDSLFLKADEALYVAKQQGRNCVRVATRADYLGPSSRADVQNGQGGQIGQMGQISGESISENATNATSSKNSSEIEPTSIA
jgi:diguanylate cyclase (GGDEF)-like protein